PALCLSSAAPVTPVPCLPVPHVDIRAGWTPPRGAGDEPDAGLRSRRLPAAPTAHRGLGGIRLLKLRSKRPRLGPVADEACRPLPELRPRQPQDRAPGGLRDG